MNLQPNELGSQSCKLLFLSVDKNSHFCSFLLKVSATVAIGPLQVGEFLLRMKTSIML